MSDSEEVRTTPLRAEYDGLYGDADPSKDFPGYRHWLEQKVTALKVELGGHFLTDDGRKLRGLEWQAYLQTEMGLQGLELRRLKIECEELAELANDLTVTKRELALRQRQLARILKIAGGSDA